jgi:type VI secretion system Hcp family effector
MDNHIFCVMQANGTSLGGDVTMTEVGGVDVSADHIECVELRWGSVAPESRASGSRGGRADLDFVQMTKPTDKVTPLLYAAFSTNATIEAEFKLFDRNPEDGSVRHRFSLTLGSARIAAIRSVVNDTTRPDYRPSLTDTLSLVGQEVTFSDLVNSTEMHMNWLMVR